MSSKISRFISKVKGTSLPSSPNGSVTNHKDFAGTEESSTEQSHNGAPHNTRRRDRTLSLTEEKEARRAAREVEDRQQAEAKEAKEKEVHDQVRIRTIVRTTFYSSIGSIEGALRRFHTEWPPRR